MNFIMFFEAALRGCLPHPAERLVRVQQSKIVNSLAAYEIYACGDRVVSKAEYRDTRETWKRGDDE